MIDYEKSAYRLKRFVDIVKEMKLGMSSMSGIKTQPQPIDIDFDIQSGSGLISPCKETVNTTAMKGCHQDNNIGSSVNNGK